MNETIKDTNDRKTWEYKITIILIDWYTNGE